MLLKQPFLCLGLFAIGNRRQRLDIDDDVFERIFRHGRRIGDNNGDRLADIPHLLMRQDRLVKHLELRQRLQAQRESTGTTLPRSAAVST